MRTFLSVVIMVAMASAAEAQADFSQLAVKPGSRVWITNAAGIEVSGEVTEIQPRLLVIETYRFEPGPGLKIERAGDSLWNGIIIGAAIGSVAGATIGAEACLDTSNAYCAIGGAVTYGVLGALIDWIRTGRKVIYDGTSGAARWAPAVGLFVRDGWRLDLSVVF